MNCSGVKPSVQRDKKFKEKPDTKWNKGAMTSGQDPSQPSFQLGCASVYL